MVVNVHEFYPQQQKEKGKDGSKAAFEALSSEKRVKFTYKVMEMVESKYNKRPKLSKADQEFLDKYEKKPSHPGTAYSLFLNDKMADPEIIKLPHRERFGVIGGLWKALDEATKQSG